MREIKFRAYLERHAYMAYQGTPDLETIQSFIHHFGDEKLMQFTGFKDKIGKEIYEDDIVRQKIEDVVCEEGFFYWYAVIKNVKGCWVAMQLGFDYSKSPFHDYTLVSDDHEEFEVEGNICENPGLLEVGSNGI